MVIKRFVFEPNGEEVCKLTDSEVIGYIPSSVPMEVQALVPETWGPRRPAAVPRAAAEAPQAQAGTRRARAPAHP